MMRDHDGDDKAATIATRLRHGRLVARRYGYAGTDAENAESLETLSHKLTGNYNDSFSAMHESRKCAIAAADLREAIALMGDDDD